jgi:hypothetical protein
MEANFRVIISHPYNLHPTGLDNVHKSHQDSDNDKKIHIERGDENEPHEVDHSHSFVDIFHPLFQCEFLSLSTSK